jgi:feruloyl-CoA synthase
MHRKAMLDAYIKTPFAPRASRFRREQDGTIYIESETLTCTFGGQLSEHLRRWADIAPMRAFLAERDVGNAWRKITYSEARRRVDSYSQALLNHGHAPGHPIAALAGNCIEHVLLMLAAMQIGIPFLSVSFAYSRPTTGYHRLRNVLELVRPSALFLDRATDFPAIFHDLQQVDVEAIVSEVEAQEPEQHARDEIARQSRRPVAVLEEWVGTRLSPAMQAAYDRVGSGTTAKILMTSGSTGNPKGVIISQGMMWANGVGVDAAWPFLAAHPPVLVDWLPLSHTFASAFNLNQILRHGGTLYIDYGRPQPPMIEITLANLRDVGPTLLYNVPRAFDLLLARFEQDPDLTRDVFRNLDVIFYAGAHLPASNWRRLMALSRQARGALVPILTSLGATETGPVATLRHWVGDSDEGIGDPIAGTQLKLVPFEGKLEVRVAGPSVTVGYIDDPLATKSAFDEAGFFKLGDAVRFVDSIDGHCLVYDGRLAENFKLSTGSWVHVSELRLILLDVLAPLVDNLAIAGPNRDEIGILAFLNGRACGDYLRSIGSPTASDGGTAIAAEIARRIHRHNETHIGTSTTIRRCMVLHDIPSVDSGEMTDKGYLNQRAVLAHRALDVEALFSVAGDELIVI